MEILDNNKMTEENKIDKQNTNKTQGSYNT